MDIEERVEAMVGTIQMCSTYSRRVQSFLVGLVRTFLHHASIVRPLSEHGKLKLANEMAQIEFLLGAPLAAVGLSTSDLGVLYQSLRAVR